MFRISLSILFPSRALDKCLVPESLTRALLGQGVPKDFGFSLFEDDWDQFDELLQGALHRVPELASVSVQSMVNGPESFTPDMRYLLGPVPEMDNLFVATGLNSTGIASAGELTLFCLSHFPPSGGIPFLSMLLTK